MSQQATHFLPIIPFLFFPLFVRFYDNFFQTSNKVLPRYIILFVFCRHGLKALLCIFPTAPLNDTLLEAIAEHDSSNVGVNYGVVGPMLPETIAVLNEFYEPFIHRLAELLQDNKFLWKDIVVT